MVTSVASNQTRGFEWSSPAVPRFLDALARASGGRLAYLVGTDAGGAIVASHRSRPIPDGDRSALDTVAREWLAAANGETARRTLASGDVVDIAAVRAARGEPIGALLLTRPSADRTDRAIALAEVEVAAALVPSVLTERLSTATRQGLLDWAATRTGGRTAFVVSIDRLNALNDVLGYAAGDHVLWTLVTRLERWAGPAGRMVRAGGARYIVIRSDLTVEAVARREAERLRSALAEPIDVGPYAAELTSGRISRSASIGVSVDADGTATAETLLLRAVRSNAVARTAGGDRVEIYDAESATARVAQLQLELELPGALEDNQLRMHYQPEYDLRTGRIIAVEALLRWQHPRHGLLGADAFVPAAEQTHTFAAVQRWIIDETCAQLARWQGAGVADQLAVRLNVAAPQVLRGDLTATLDKALAREGLSGDQICMEITERSLPDDPTALAEVLNSWRARGATVAVDDFGTGDGTLTHLLDLPLDAVKIDQTFVSRMRTDVRSTAIVESTVTLARTLGLAVVAEGVDGPSTIARLLELGCWRGQGNGLAEAMAPERVAELLLAQGDA